MEEERVPPPIIQNYTAYSVDISGNKRGLPKPDWEKDEEVLECPQCKLQFGFLLRRHHCRGCGKIFCHEHCRQWILLPFDFKDPERVCKDCYKKYCGIDFSKMYDEYGPENAPTIIVLHGELGNRNNMLYQIKSWAEKYRVISIDLPGHGANAGSSFKYDLAVNEVAEVIKAKVFNKKALIFGYSIGGNVAMLLTKQYPELCSGLVLCSCSRETYGITSHVLFGTMDIFYTAIPDSLKWKIVPNMLSHIPREDIEEPILRAGVNYDNWTHLSRNCIEPSEGCFVTAIHSYPGPILVVNGEKDDRPSEARFVQAAAKAKLHVIKGATSSVIYEREKREELNEVVLEFAKEIFQ